MNLKVTGNLGNTLISTLSSHITLRYVMVCGKWFGQKVPRFNMWVNLYLSKISLSAATSCEPVIDHTRTILVLLTVKSFHFMDTKVRGLSTLDMFGDTWTRWFQIICKITKMNKYFVGILNYGIALPTKYLKLNVQRIKMISQYSKAIKWS